jgi:hypothetical protein
VNRLIQLTVSTISTISTISDISARDNRSMLFGCCLLLRRKIEPLRPAKSGLCIILYHDGCVICSAGAFRVVRGACQLVEKILVRGICKARDGGESGREAVPDRRQVEPVCRADRGRISETEIGRRETGQGSRVAQSIARSTKPQTRPRTFSCDSGSGSGKA